MNRKYKLTFEKDGLSMTILFATDFVKVLKSMAVWKKDGYEITEFERVE